jgi:hypothetical protein
MSQLTPPCRTPWVESEIAPTFSEADAHGPREAACLGYASQPVASGKISRASEYKAHLGLLGVMNNTGKRSGGLPTGWTFALKGLIFILDFY